MRALRLTCSQSSCYPNSIGGPIGGVSMGAMPTVSVVLLGLCLLAGVVLGQQQPDPAWQFSLQGNTAEEDPQGGRLVPTGTDGFEYQFGKYDAGVAGNPEQDENSFSDTQGGHLVPTGSDGFEYQFGKYDAGVTGNPDQDVNSYSDKPDQFRSSEYNYDSQFRSEELTSGDEPQYVNGANSQGNAVPYDYNNQISTQSDAVSYAVDVPETRSYTTQEDSTATPDYVYDARSGSGTDVMSFTTLDAARGSDSDKALPVSTVTSSSEDDVFDAQAGSAGAFSTDTVSFSTAPPPPSTEHHGPVGFYTPASDANGAFRYYDGRTEEEKKATSALDADPTVGAASFSTVATTQPILAMATHGCPNSYWAAHVAAWPSQLKITTPVCEAFSGVNLKKTLEIIYGTTTVFQALLDLREDPYSSLLRHGVASLLNSYAKSAFPQKPAEVSRLFHAALASKAAAAAQAQKFENENHAFGDSECK